MTLVKFVATLFAAASRSYETQYPFNVADCVAGACSPEWQWLNLLLRYSRLQAAATKLNNPTIVPDCVGGACSPEWQWLNLLRRCSRLQAAPTELNIHSMWQIV